MLLRVIKEILGGDVSTKNSKMPGTSFGLSTEDCFVGGKLRDIEGSVCESCYAARIENFRPSVKKGWRNRTEAVRKACLSQEGMDLWVEAMVQRLGMLKPTHHRWHDSGDLQSEYHLEMIVEVARALPDIMFWLPTKERAIIKRFTKHRGFPKNLCVRESAAMVGEKLNTDTPSSMVVDKKDVADTFSDGVYICPSSHQGNACMGCRACWHTTVTTVAYIKH